MFGNEQILTVDSNLGKKLQGIRLSLDKFQNSFKVTKKRNHEEYEVKIVNSEELNSLLNADNHQTAEFSQPVNNNLLEDQNFSHPITNQLAHEGSTDSNNVIEFPIIEEERIEPLPPLRPVNQPNNQITETSTYNFSSPFNFFSPSLQLPSPSTLLSPNILMELDDLSSQSRNNNQEANNTLSQKHSKA